MLPSAVGSTYRANDCRIVAVEECAGYGNIRVFQSVEHSVFATNVVSSSQQVARGLLADDIAVPVGRREQVLQPTRSTHTRTVRTTDDA